MYISPAQPTVETANAISGIIVGNFETDPMYTDYDPTVLQSYVDSNSPDRTLEALVNPDTQCFVGEVRDSIVGAVVLGYYPSGYPNQESDGAWRIRRLHLGSAFRGQGYASRLLSAAEVFVGDQGHDTIYAEPTPEASGLLRRHGWNVGEPVIKEVTFRKADGTPTKVLVPRYIAHKPLATASV
jgi:GNAT superfamily N-acetyltransferase